FLRRDAHASGGPHIGDIEILGAVVVVIEPADAHASADVFNSSLRSDIGKGPIAVVAIQILPAKVVHHVEVGPAVAVVIAPSATKTVARVVPIKARLRGDVAETSVPVVAHHEVGWAVLRVVIRRGILVLVCALIINVEAKVNVQPAIAVIVGNGRSRESPLRRVGEFERVGPLTKLAAAFVQKQQWTTRAYNDQVLLAVVINVGKKRAGRILEDPGSRCFGDVLEGSIPAVSIQPVGKAGWLAH